MMYYFVLLVDTSSVRTPRFPGRLGQEKAKAVLVCT